MIHRPAILYVDDEPDNLFVFQQTFKSDFAITTAESGETALSILETKSFEIILVDQRMPKMSGVELLERLKIGESESIRILLTGYSDIQAVVDAINRGRIYYYCSKPWKRDELKMILLKSIEFLDLSRRNKQLIKDLSNTVKELDTFLYRASHNLKTPITSQLGLLSLLRLEIGDNSTVVNLIQQSINALQSTIRKMEALSNSGYAFLKDQYQINVSGLIQEIINEHASRIQHHQIVVQEQVTQHGEFLSYKESLKILLDCIIENALSFPRSNHQDGHRVIIEALKADQSSTLLVKVVDNGVGISKEVLPHVFDPFYRGSQESSGSGLGLFVAKKITDALGGSIQIESNPGTGTEVQITVPGIPIT